MIHDVFGEALRPFPRQRFECYIQHAVRVVRWHARSSAFVGETMVWAQWPQLCCEIGPLVVDFNGPEDLQLLAIVEPVKGGRPGELMPVAFTRQDQKGQFPVMTCKCGHSFAEHCGPSRAVECSVLGCACQGFDDAAPAAEVPPSDYFVSNAGPTCVHGRNLGVLCVNCLRATLPDKVERWLERHHGARLIVTSESVELCARELRSEPTDTGRYVSRDNVSAAQREDVLSEMVDEMAIWEANGWEYEMDRDEMERYSK